MGSFSRTVASSPTGSSPFRRSGINTDSGKKDIRDRSKPFFRVRAIYIRPAQAMIRERRVVMTLILPFVEGDGHPPSAGPGKAAERRDIRSAFADVTCAMDRSAASSVTSSALYICVRVVLRASLQTAIARNHGTTPVRPLGASPETAAARPDRVSN